MPDTRVAVAGPNSALAPSVFESLLAAGFTITALARDTSKTKLDPAITVVKADYSSADSLAPSLEGQDAVVDLLNDKTMAASIMLVDAAIVAGVKHIIPGSFGLDFQNDFMRTVPLVAGKIKLEDHVIAKGQEDKINYTIIETGMFLDWALSKGYILPLDGGEVQVFDGGEAKQSFSLLQDIGKAVATALVKRGDTAVRNKILFMHSITASPKQIVEYARLAVGDEKRWVLQSSDANEIYEKSKAAFAEGKRDPMVFRGFLAGYIQAGTNLFKDVDNNILDVKEIGQEELKGVVAAFVKVGSEAKFPYRKA